ncbi:MAG TPA: protein translocase subunit SecD [Acidobacteriaceae bacterium]|jgi:preprotein translocase subunit SecD|nr:protein translocase subunit SecD [Acidobacteriaceae bacterium]
MKTNIRTRLIVIIAVLVVFVYGVFGIPRGLSGNALTQGLLNGGVFRKGIHLGLDLKGGMHLILQVKVDEAIGAETDTDVAAIQSDLQKNGISGATVSKPDANRADFIQVSGVPADHNNDVRSLLENSYSTRFDVAPGVGNTWTLTMKPTEESAAKQRALDQAIEVITSRTNTLGVSEPIIEPYQLGSYQILVELPGVDDLGRVKDVIQSTARLEAHEVTGGPFPDQQSALQSVGGYLPPDSELIQSVPGASANGSVGEWFELKKIPIWGGTDVRDAQPGHNPNTNEPEVDFYLTSAAGDRFATWTGANIGKSMAIVLDNRVQEVAVIKGQIRDQGNISGGGISEERVKDLSMLLRTGALPASIEFMQETTVGPSLGADSIHQGVVASIVGMVTVMAFMLLYYRGAGINADLALFLNLVILLGFLGFSGATLTLPGIAGVILTIGMGVDSNVLIFERIREELRAGKSPSAAVDQGFGHAWTTIVDTHVTTIVSALILFIFGTGPVKGFAVTLTFGLLANLFTAVFVSRVIFDAHLSRKLHGEPISI